MRGGDAAQDAEKRIAILRSPRKIDDEIGVDPGTEEGCGAEEQLRNGFVEREMLFPAGDAQQRIDGHLEHRHADADDEERDEGHAVRGVKREADRAERRADEGAEHYRFFRVAFHEEARGNGHDPVGDKESEDEEARRAKAGGEGADDVRNNGTEDIAEQRDDEEDEEDKADQEAASYHTIPPTTAPRSGDARRARLQ